MSVAPGPGIEVVLIIDLLNVVTDIVFTIERVVWVEERIAMVDMTELVDPGILAGDGEFMVVEGAKPTSDVRGCEETIDETCPSIVQISPILPQMPLNMSTVETNPAIPLSLCADCEQVFTASSKDFGIQDVTLA